MPQENTFTLHNAIILIQAVSNKNQYIPQKIFTSIR